LLAGVYLLIWPFKYHKSIKIYTPSSWMAKKSWFTRFWWLLYYDHDLRQINCYFLSQNDVRLAYIKLDNADDTLSCINCDSIVDILLWMGAILHFYSFGYGEYLKAAEHHRYWNYSRKSLHHQHAQLMRVIRSKRLSKKWFLFKTKMKNGLKWCLLSNEFKLLCYYFKRLL